MVLGSVDWTTVIVAAIGVIPAILSAYWAYRIRRDIRTPSGDTIGKVTERTHDLSAADLLATQAVHKIVTTSERRDQAQDLDEGTGRT